MKTTDELFKAYSAICNIEAYSLEDCLQTTNRCEGIACFIRINLFENIEDPLGIRCPLPLEIHVNRIGQNIGWEFTRTLFICVNVDLFHAFIRLLQILKDQREIVVINQITVIQFKHLLGVLQGVIVFTERGLENRNFIEQNALVLVRYSLIGEEFLYVWIGEVVALFCHVPINICPANKGNKPCPCLQSDL